MIPTDYKTKKQAQQYSDYRFQKGLNQVSLDELILLDKWLSRITSNRKRVFVDLGTGTGRVLNTLLAHNPDKIIAVDQSDAMLFQLRENFSKKVKNKKILLINQRSDETKLESDSINAVTAFHLIKHLGATLPTFKEISRILKKDGIFIFDALNKNSIIVFNLGSCVATSEKELESQLLKHGFKIKARVYMHPLGETVYNTPRPFYLLIKLLDKLISTLFPTLGTKLFIMATKNE